MYYGNLYIIIGSMRFKSAQILNLSKCFAVAAESARSAESGEQTQTSAVIALHSRLQIHNHNSDYLYQTAAAPWGAASADFASQETGAFAIVRNKLLPLRLLNLAHVDHDSDSAARGTVQ